jgi:threonine dehydratase
MPHGALPVATTSVSTGSGRLLASAVAERRSAAVPRSMRRSPFTPTSEATFRSTIARVDALPVGPDDVARAARAIAGRLHRTPIFTLRSVRAGLHLKAELFQRTGSFKPRGVLTKLAALTPEERAAGVIAVSAGNHAQALAWGAAQEGLSALLVMWEGADASKAAATRAYGAELDQEATGPADAFRRLDELIAETGRTLVHPFGDPRVIAGQGTVGLELLEDLDSVDTVVVPVGGGGLVSGIAAACATRGVRVVGVEPDASPALHAGLAAGKSVPVEPLSIADALNAPFAGDLPVAICTALGVEVVLVSDEEIAGAFRLLYGRAKLACEPGAAAGLAAVLSGKVEGDRIVCVVSGGNVAPASAAAILASP